MTILDIFTTLQIGEGLQIRFGKLLIIRTICSMIKYPSNRWEKKYFSSLYKDPQSSNICDRLSIIKIFPTFLNSIDCDVIGGPITLAEVEKTLKGFSKDKSPGPDGWTIEFYLHFFDLLSLELV